MTTYVIPGGNLLSAACSFKLINIFAHGANCWSTMGAGIALHVAKNFPAIYGADSNDPRSPDQRLGGMSYGYDHGKGVWGANLYTQFYPGPNARMPSIISSVQLLFEQVHDIVEATPEEVVYVGFPAIGCGIGGLKLQDVVRNIHFLADGLFVDNRRRVVPVFYIMESEKFSKDLQELATCGLDIQIMNDEDEIIDEEA